MPEKNRLKKRQQAYAGKIYAFENVSQDEPLYQEKWSLAASLSALTKLIDEFSPYDSAGNEKQIPPPAPDTVWPGEVC